MLVFQKKCNVCQAIKTNKPLMRRIYECSYFVPYSKDTMLDIARDYAGAKLFTYDNLKNHVKKHQFIDSQDYTDKMLAHEDKKQEKLAVRKAVKAVDAVQTIIEKGMERLDSGEITVDTNQLIRASQVKLTHESKQKDQELATIEMVAHFLSGENSEKIFIKNDN